MPNKMFYFTGGDMVAMKRMYEEFSFGSHLISGLFGCSAATALSAMKNSGVKTRSREESRRITGKILGHRPREKGIKFTAEHRANMSRGMMGHRNALGRKAGPEERALHSRLVSGPLNPMWKGGRGPVKAYGGGFTNHLKYKVKNRDGNKCYICDGQSKKRCLSVHHKDYNYGHSAEDNLITLCNSCHQRTNFNRAEWMFLFDTLDVGYSKTIN